jgi:hypothetical protein
VYIDAMVRRDRDADANGTLDERVYPLFDANFNVSSIVGDECEVIERYCHGLRPLRLVCGVELDSRACGCLNEFLKEALCERHGVSWVSNP